SPLTSPTGMPTMGIRMHPPEQKLPQLPATTDTAGEAPPDGWVAPRLLSVIIPVYNEEATVAEVIERVQAVQRPIQKETISVDDGATEKTPDVLRDVARHITQLHVSPVNFGKGSAVRVGLKLAQGGIILIQDADLELDPNEYGRLLEPILKGET